MPTALLESVGSDNATLATRPDVMQQLRESTGKAHKSVERKTPFFKADFDLPRYKRWTQCMLGFYRPFECALAGSTLLTSGRWAYQFRTPLLTKDLAWLGEPHAIGLRLPAQASIPDLSDPLRALGALYVVEGSALGGQVISGRIAKTLGLSVENGAAFYHPNGHDPRTAWQGFQSLTLAKATHSAAEEAIVAGAVSTFQAFDDWLLACGWVAPS